jgi:hypothetical protein
MMPLTKVRVLPSDLKRSNTAMALRELMRGIVNVN